MRYFCHAQLFEITRANKIEIPYFATIVPKRLSCARIRGRNSSNFLSRAPLTNPYSHSLLRRCPTSRDFVPWRFLDAGQLSVRSLLVAGVQKPAQTEKYSARADVFRSSSDNGRGFSARKGRYPDRRSWRLHPLFRRTIVMECRGPLGANKDQVILLFSDRWVHGGKVRVNRARTTSPRPPALLVCRKRCDNLRSDWPVACACRQ